MLQIYGTQAISSVLPLSRQTGEPQINVSSTPPSNKLSIGGAINLTATAWQTNALAKNPRTRPYIIEWFDPQDKRIGRQCRAGWPPARLMNCTLELGALTDGNLGNYTCRARNGYNYCSTKKIQIALQGKGKKAWRINCKKSSYGARVSVHWVTGELLYLDYDCANLLIMPKNIHQVMSSPSSIPINLSWFTFDM